MDRSQVWWFTVHSLQRCVLVVSPYPQRRGRLLAGSEEGWRPHQSAGREPGERVPKRTPEEAWLAPPACPSLQPQGPGPVTVAWGRCLQERKYEHENICSITEHLYCKSLTHFVLLSLQPFKTNQIINGKRTGSFIALDYSLPLTWQTGQIHLTSSFNILYKFTQ